MKRLATALIFVTGCFTSSQTAVQGPTQVSSSEPQMVCRSETPTGSLISREVCHPKDDPEGELNRASILRAMELPRPNPCGPGGCPMHP